MPPGQPSRGDEGDIQTRPFLQNHRVSGCMAESFARRMMAQRLMTDARATPFSDSAGFGGRSTPDSLIRAIPDPVDASLAARSDDAGRNVFADIGSALVGDTDVDSGYILPLGKTPEGDIVPAFPKLLQGAAAGVRDAAVTAGRALSGDPRYVPVDGELSPEVIDEINNFGLTVMGGGMTGANLLKGSIPEGAIGIFAGRKGRGFPAAGAEKTQALLDQQKTLMSEYQYVSQELTKGRMQLGDDTTDALVERRAQLIDQMDANTSQLGTFEDDVLPDLEKRFASTDDASFFRETERDFGKGLFKLPDNQFRFEIDDRPAQIKLDIPDDSAALFGDITGDALERVLPNTSELGGVKLRLSEFLDHDELYENYPQLKDYPVVIKYDRKDPGRGSFNPRTNTIEINLGDMGPIFADQSISGKELKKRIKSTLVHEIQHAVQEIEGFARGSNPSVSNPLASVTAAINQNESVLASVRNNEFLYNAARSDISKFADAERIKYYEEMALRDSFQPRRLFNQANWYRYGDEIRRELSDELGYTYNKRKSPKREQWIAAAFAKLAKYERGESGEGAYLADKFSMKELKSKLGKATRLANKHYDDWATARNARYALEKFYNDPRYATDNPQAAFNVYLDSLGEAEARVISARAEPAATSDFGRSLFPPQQFQEGGMEAPPPFGLENTLRQQGGFFKN